MRDLNEPETSPAGNGGVVPPPEHRWKPGQSGNPRGRPAAGASLREWVNVLCDQAVTEADLRRVAGDPVTPFAKRAAAHRMLNALEAPDLADFEPVIRGEKTLAQLRDEGVNTDVVKRIKPAAGGGRELELHDRAGAEFDRICDRTDGRPRQAVQVDAQVAPATAVEVIIPGLGKRRGGVL